MTVVSICIAVYSAAWRTSVASATLVCRLASCLFDWHTTRAERVHVPIFVMSIRICPAMGVACVKQRASVVVAGVEESTNDLGKRHTIVTIVMRV